jgi:hypothetical protein
VVGFKIGYFLVHALMIELDASLAMIAKVVVLGDTYASTLSFVRLFGGTD